MARYKVEAPDGKMLTIEGPEGASDAEVLQQAEALYNAKQEPEQKTSKLRQLGYGSAGARSDIGNLGDIIETYIPTGRFFNPTETYGEEFMQMEPGSQERRDFLTNRRLAMRDKEYADVIAANETDTLSAKIGSFGGAIASPTTLIPIGQGYKAVAGVSALLGAEYDILDQYMKTGEVDPVQTAKVAGLSAAGGTATIWGGRQIGKVYNKLKNKQGNASPLEVKEAEEIADRVNDLAFKARAEGVADDALPNYIKENSDLDSEDIAMSFMISDVRPIIPTLAEVKVAQAIGDNGLDTVNRINNNMLQDIWAPIADRLEAVSPRLATRLREVDLQFHMKSNERANRAKPFMKIYSKLNAGDKRTMKGYLLNGDFNAARKMFSKVEGGEKSFKEVTKLLDEMHYDLVSSGYKTLPKLYNYFPRKVTDVKALRKSLGVEATNIFERAIAKRKTELKISQKGSLPDAEEVRILNEVARGRLGSTDAVGGVRFGQKRVIENIRDDQLDLYADPLEGLTSYIRSATNNAEKRRFFGGAGKTITNDVLDIEESVGSIVQKELQNIPEGEAATVRNILNARFTTGEMSASKTIQTLRSLTYLTKLANPFSAATQAADLSASVWINGLGNSVQSLLGPGARRVSMQKLGLDQVMAEEFSNEKVLAKTLNGFFTASGFRHIDRFGKNVLINSTLKRVEKLAKTPAGIKKLAEKHQSEFGVEFPKLVNSLRNGQIDDNVKLLLWNELAKAQPISLSEMPLKYLQMPNGKVLYALKTFAAKQLSNTLRRTRGEWKKGNKKEAVKNTATWLMTVPTAGVGVDKLKDYIRYGSQEMPYEDNETMAEFALDHADHALKLFGASQFMVEKLAEGDISGALGGIRFFAPGLSTIEGVGDAVITGFSEGTEKIDKRILKDIPLVGQMYYYWLGGGIEEDYDRAVNREIKKRSER